MQSELAAIISTQDVTVDLTKSYQDFMDLAEQKFVQFKSAYEGNVKSKNTEITTKMNEIRTLLNEAKLILFDSNGVQYNPP